MLIPCGEFKSLCKSDSGEIAVCVTICRSRIQVIHHYPGGITGLGTDAETRKCTGSRHRAQGISPHGSPQRLHVDILSLMILFGLVRNCKNAVFAQVQQGFVEQIIASGIADLGNEATGPAT